MFELNNSGSYGHLDLSRSFAEFEGVELQVQDQNLDSDKETHIHESHQSLAPLFYSRVNTGWLENSGEKEKELGEKEKEKEKEKELNEPTLAHKFQTVRAPKSKAEKVDLFEGILFEAPSFSNENARSTGSLKLKAQKSIQKGMKSDFQINSYSTVFDAPSFSNESAKSTGSLKLRKPKKLKAQSSIKPAQKKTKTIKESSDDLSNSLVKLLLCQVDLNALKSQKIDQVEGHFVAWNSIDEEIVVAKKKAFAKGTSKKIYKAASFNTHTFGINPSRILGIIGQQGIESLNHEKSAIEHLKSKTKGTLSSDYVLLPTKITLSRSGNRGVVTGDLGGKSLDQLIRKEMPVREKMGLGIQVFKALRFLHKKNIVHRDIKPDNFVLRMDRQGMIKKDDKGRPCISIIDLGNCYIPKTKEGKEIQKFRVEYMDPRFHSVEDLMKMLEKGFPSDIDSYMAGMILINIFSGDNVNQFLDRSVSEAGNKGVKDSVKYNENLLNWKNDYLNWPVWEEIKENLVNQLVPKEQRNKIIKLLQSSIHPDPRKRPSEKKILRALIKLENIILCKRGN